MQKYTINISKKNKEFLLEIIQNNLRKSNFSKTSIRSIINEGLLLLKSENETIIDIVELLPIRRFIPGKDKKESKNKIIKTTIDLEEEDINWINSFIYYRMNSNMSYSKINFSDELFERLKEEYKICDN